SAADRSRLDPLSGIVAALGDRSDRQAVMTVRPADRQIRDILAARTDELTRRWLSELFDHRDRIVTALEHLGVVVPSADRSPLIRALVAGDRAATVAWLKREISRDTKLIAAAVAATGILGTAPASRSARRRRPRGVKILNREVTHQRRE